MGSAKYTEEYRRETSDYIISTGRPVTVVARELGMSEKTASRWVVDRRRRLSSGPDPKEGDRELHEARERIRELEMENVFLKNPKPSSTAGLKFVHPLCEQLLRFWILKPANGVGKALPVLEEAIGRSPLPWLTVSRMTSAVQTPFYSQNTTTQPSNFPHFSVTNVQTMHLCFFQLTVQFGSIILAW